MKPWSQGWLIAAGAYPSFCSMKRLEVFLLPLNGMLVHRRSLPRNFVRFPQQIAGTHLYTWVERGTVRVMRNVKPWSQGWLIAAGAYPSFCSMKRLEVFLLLLNGMLVHRRSLPRNFVRFPQQIAGTHLYTWVERGTVRVKCLAQEHNTLSPARARTRTARSGVERTNHEATAK